MRYDLQSELRRKDFAMAVTKAWENGYPVEFTVIRQRSLNQNAYLHACLNYLAQQYGETMDYFKQIIFKRVWNRDIFLRVMMDEKLGQAVEYWRSTADLEVEEMSRAIDNMRNRAAKDMGIYIPSPEEKELVYEMQRQTWR